MKTAISSLVVASILAYAGNASAGDTCVYVTGQVNGGSVTTPAVIVIVPDINAVITPAHVVVDETNQEILGYVVPLPGAEVTTPEQSIFVEGTSEQVDSYSAHLDDLNVGRFRCVQQDVDTPAVPIYIPGDHLEIPGVLTTTPGTTITIAQQQVTVPAYTINIPGHTIIVPAFSETIPPQHVETPEESVVVNETVPWVVPYLHPLVVDGNEVVNNVP